MPNLLKSSYSLLFLIILFCSRHKVFAQNWQIVGGGLSSYVGDINIDKTSNSLYIGGAFSYADTINCYGIINWDGNIFSKLKNPINGCGLNCFQTGSILKYHNSLFMTGEYGPYIGRVEYLFEYVSNNWVPSCTMGQTSSGLSNLLIINDKLFALGIFDSLCNQNIQCLSMYNGSNWDAFNLPSPIKYNPLLGGSNYLLKTGEYYKGEYYFGGNFHDGFNKEVIRWTGTQWTSLQSGIFGSMADVTCMKVYNDVLYVGGLFYSADGNSADCLMAWDGSNWYNPFPQVTFIDYVNDLEIINNELYISGNYITASSNDSNMYVLARYNGCDFNIFGASYKFQDYESAPRCIAGLNGKIYAAVNDSFMHKSAKYLVSILDIVANIKTIHISSCETSLSDLNLSIFPNPYSEMITIQLSNDFNLYETKFIITNSLGQILLIHYPNSISEVLNLSLFSSGMYYLTVQDKSNKKTIKIIKQ